MSDDVFREIEDDLRHEKLRQFWKENGAWVIGSVIAAIIMTAVLSFWQGWSHRRDMAATSALAAALATGDVQKITAFAEGEGRKNHALFALLTAAAREAETGKADEAAALYDRAAGLGGADRTLRDLARLLAVGQRLDRADPAALTAQLETLSSGKNPWRFSAAEMQGLLAVRQGDAARAADIFARLAGDAAAPGNLRRRALALHEHYAIPGAK